METIGTLTAMVNNLNLARNLLSNRVVVFAKHFCKQAALKF